MMKKHNAIRILSAVLLSAALATQLFSCKTTTPNNGDQTSGQQSQQQQQTESTGDQTEKEPTAEELMTRLTAALTKMNDCKKAALKINATAKVAVAGITMEIPFNIDIAADETDESKPLLSMITSTKRFGQSMTSKFYYTADGTLYVDTGDSKLYAKMTPEQMQEYIASQGNSSIGDVDFSAEDLAAVGFRSVTRTVNEDGSTTLTLKDAASPEKLNNLFGDLAGSLGDLGDDTTEITYENLTLQFTLSGEQDTLTGISVEMKLSIPAGSSDMGDDDETDTGDAEEEPITMTMEFSMNIEINTESVTVAEPENKDDYTEVTLDDLMGDGDFDWDDEGEWDFDDEEEAG